MLSEQLLHALFILIVLGLTFYYSVESSSLNISNTQKKTTTEFFEIQEAVVSKPEILRGVFWSRPYPSFPFNELKNWKKSCPYQGLDTGKEA